MGWARFDDQYSDHPKILEAGPWAELLDMRAIIWCARYETDGVVSEAALRRIGHGIPRLSERVAMLIRVSRWSQICSGEWVVNDFLDYNPSRESRADMRERGRERVRKHRQAKNGNALQPRISLWGRGNSLSADNLSANSPRPVSRCARCNQLIGDGWSDCECPDLSVVGGDE